MAEIKVNQKVIQNLQKYFGIGFKKTAQIPSDQLFPIKKIKDVHGYSSFKKEDLPDEIKRLFNFWLNDTHSTLPHSYQAEK